MLGDSPKVYIHVTDRLSAYWCLLHVHTVVQVRMGQNRVAQKWYSCVFFLKMLYPHSFLWCSIIFPVNRTSIFTVFRHTLVVSYQQGHIISCSPTLHSWKWENHSTSCVIHQKWIETRDLTYRFGVFHMDPENLQLRVKAPHVCTETAGSKCNRKLHTSTIDLRTAGSVFSHHLGPKLRKWMNSRRGYSLGRSGSVTWWEENTM